MTEHIPGIYNYCDRWCERCVFTKRCRIFSEQQSIMEEVNAADESEDDGSEKLLKHALDSFAEAMRLIQNWAKAHGVTLDTDNSDMPERNPSIEAAKEQLVSAGRNYAKMTDKWFSVNSYLFKDKEQEMQLKFDLEIGDIEKEFAELVNALEVIRHYLFFIPAKINRAFANLGWDFDEDETVQNDSNGSAKIVLIAISKSLSSWEMIRQFFPEKTDELIDILMSLQKLKGQMETQFPSAYAFKRPGFDDII